MRPLRAGAFAGRSARAGSVGLCWLEARVALQSRWTRRDRIFTKPGRVFTGRKQKMRSCLEGEIIRFFWRLGSRRHCALLPGNSLHFPLLFNVTQRKHSSKDSYLLVCAPPAVRQGDGSYRRNGGYSLFILRQMGKLFVQRLLPLYNTPDII